MRLHHTAILVDDLERSIDFYSRVFGFHLAERGEFEGHPLAFLIIDGGMIELVQDRSETRTEGVVNHIAFVVNDLSGEMARLRSAGVPLLDEVPVPVFSGGRIAFCEGPDGELIELMQGPGDGHEAW